MPARTRKFEPKEIDNVFDGHSLYLRIFAESIPSKRKPSFRYTATISKMKTPEDRVFRATDEYSDFVMACRYKGNEREFVIASHDKLNEAQVETLTSYLSGEWFKKTYITGIMNDSDGVLSQHEEYGDEVFCQPLDELRVDRYIMMV